jgi:TolB protein
MFLRIYRVTDRLGYVCLRLAAEVGQWWLSCARSASRLTRRTSGGVIGLVVMLASFVAWLVTRAFMLLRGLVLGVVHGSRKLLSGLWGLLSAVLGGVLSSGARKIANMTGQERGLSAVGGKSAAHETVLRRSQHAQASEPSEAADVSLIDDPLRAQNRRLSLLVVMMGLIVVVALLWATDPSRPAAAPLTGGADTRLLALANLTATPADAAASIGIATPIPTATPVPPALRQGGTLAFVGRERGQQDIWAVSVGSRAPLRLTNDVQDERDPAWSADGARLAYASRQDGNWEIYVYDVPNQETTRITYDLSFQGGPSWSPDNLWIVYESYQGQNLDIYAVPIDGSQTPQRLTDHPAPDFSPAWSPDGRRVAFVSLRDGVQDIYILSLDTLEIVNLTQNALRDEDYPTWSPDGQWLAYSAWEQGSEKVFVQRADAAGGQAQVLSFGRTPGWSPDGRSLVVVVDAADASQSYLYVVPFDQSGAVATEVISVPYGASKPRWTDRGLPPQLVNSGGLPLGVVEPLYVEQEQSYSTGAPYRLSALPNVQAPRAFLSDRVNDSFNALRARVLQLSSVDFFQTLDDAWWDLERRPSPGEERRNWHMTGRAFAFQRSAILGFPPQIEVQREEVGVDTLWRVYLRVSDDAQNGQLGEPLRRLPWDFLAATQGDVEAYNQGGRLRRQPPAGYYIDLTQVAADYGWLRRPSGTDWRANAATRFYNLFYKPQGMDWYTAMLETHTSGELVNFAPTRAPGS